jgi:hypothetical protein
MSGAIPPLPQYAFMARCCVKHRDSFTFTFTFYMHVIICASNYTILFRIWDRIVHCALFWFFINIKKIASYSSESCCHLVSCTKC